MSNLGKLDATRKRVREAITLFEHKEGSGLVDIQQIGVLLQHLGYNPTGDQITHVVDEIAKLNSASDHSVHIPADTIDTVVTNYLIQQEVVLQRDDYHTLIRAFRAFDTEGKGWVDGEHMRLILTTRGQIMTEDEVNKMINYCADENGRIYYEDYSQKLATDGRRI